METELQISGPISLLTKWGTMLVSLYTGHGTSGVLVRGQYLSEEPVLVRVQSSCMFSESLGAIDCDCDSQLKASIKRVLEAKGVLLYLFEEGRGTGLKIKFESIVLQQRHGLDTAQAFEALGSAADPRRYDFAYAVLASVIGSRTVQLITNNPTRVQGLLTAGLRVVSSERLVLRTAEVDAYLRGKAAALGHEVLDDD